MNEPRYTPPGTIRTALTRLWGWLKWVFWGHWYARLSVEAYEQHRQRLARTAHHDH